MDWEHVEGNWRLVQLEARERWGRLRAEDLKAIGGNRGRLIEQIQKRYGLEPGEAEDQVRRFEREVRV